MEQGKIFQFMLGKGMNEVEFEWCIKQTLFLDLKNH